MAKRFGYVPIKSSLMSDDQLEHLLSKYAPALETLGGERCAQDRVEDRVPIILFVASGGTEKEILDLWEKRKRAINQEPIFLLAPSGNNALPAAMEVLARLQQDREKGRILFLESPEDERGWREAARAVRDLEVLYTLRKARIGLVGGASEWLVSSSPESETVKETWGPEVLSIELEVLRQTIHQIQQSSIEPILKTLISGAEGIQEPRHSDIEDAVRSYLGLKHVAIDHQLDAVTVRCFDLIKDTKSTSCFALAQLNDEGIIAGCEGDLVATMGMLWAYAFLDKTPWMANPAQLNREDNSIWMTHCTVPMGLVEAYMLRSHFESGIGVAIQGKMPFGQVTLIRIGGKSMEQLWLAEGEILETGTAEDLCRTQVKVGLSDRDVMELLRTPLGNHLVLVQGHHAERMRMWWEGMIK